MKTDIYVQERIN